MSDLSRWRAMSGEHEVTGKYCVCRVCGSQWQLREEKGEFTCYLCGAPRKAIRIVSEANRQSDVD